MAQINFPVATSAGQQFEGDNGVIYTYVGTPPNGFWSGSFQATGLTTLDSRYLKLDSSNDPITAGLNITGGNVGIGTSSPQDTLSIGESSGTGSLTLFSGTTAEEDVYGKILFRHGSANGNRNAKIEALRSGGSSGADLAFYTRKQADGVNDDGGLERMRIDSDGNVGIGTSSPFTTLHVKNSGSGTSIASTGTTDSTTAYRVNRDSVGIDFGILDNGTSYIQNRLVSNFATNLNFAINPNGGNVGIGTSSPASLLHISSSSPRFTLTDTNTGVNHRINADSSAGNLAFDVDLNSGSSAPACVFNIKGSELMRIAASGNVGIGTSSPLTPLHVNSATATSTILQSATTQSLLQFKSNDTNLFFIGTTGDNWNVQTSGIQRLSITEAGNVGIGTSSPGTKLHVDGTILAETVTYTANQDQPYLIAGTTVYTGANTNWGTYGFQHRFKSNGSGTARVTIDSANGELFCVDNNGNVGIGTNSPATHLHVMGTVRVANSGAEGGQIEFSNADGTTINSFVDVTASDMRVFTNGNNRGLLLGQLVGTGGNIKLYSSQQERMRIDSGGSVLFGNMNEYAINQGTVNGRSIRTNGIMYSARATTVGASHQVFTNTNGIVGQILTSGTSTSYVTSSDYRLKENVVDIADGITRVKQLTPKRFNFIVDPDTTVDGFIAHEAQTVVPESVTGVQDATREEEYEISPEVVDEDGNVTAESVMGTRTVPDYQGIDQSKLVPLLTAALQEAIAKIETLETKVAALEAG